MYKSALPRQEEDEERPGAGPGLDFCFLSWPDLISEPLTIFRFSNRKFPETVGTSGEDGATSAFT